MPEKIYTCANCAQLAPLGLDEHQHCVTCTELRRLDDKHEVVQRDLLSFDQRLRGVEQAHDHEDLFRDLNGLRRGLGKAARYDEFAALREEVRSRLDVLEGHGTENLWIELTKIQQRLDTLEVRITDPDEVMTGWTPVGHLTEADPESVATEHQKLQAALRKLTPKQRRDMGLPDPEPYVSWSQVKAEKARLDELRRERVNTAERAYAGFRRQVARAAGLNALDGPHFEREIVDQVEQLRDNVRWWKRRADDFDQTVQHLDNKLTRIREATDDGRAVGQQMADVLEILLEDGGEN